MQQAHDPGADDNRRVAAPWREALDVVQHTRQRLRQRSFERTDGARIAIDLIAVDQSVLAKPGRSPRPTGLPGNGVLVIADIVVAAPAGPALAAAPQTGDCDLVAGRQRLGNAGADCRDLARELVAADERVRPGVNAGVDP